MVNLAQFGLTDPSGVFKKVFPISHSYEGDTYENVPGDAGGPTKHGIALYTLVSPKVRQNPKLKGFFDKDGNGKVDANDIKLLTYEDAEVCYYNFFWLPLKLDEVAANSLKKAFLCFDAALNHGNGGMAKIAQTAVNKLGLLPSKNVDGLWGPQTRRCIIEADEEEFMEAFQQARSDYYYAIVQRKPTQRKFLKGWLNRIAKTTRDAKTL